MYEINGHMHHTKGTVIQMEIQVISHVNEASAAYFPFKSVAVIDVLRATSTIAAALSLGAESVVPVETVMEARQMKLDNDILAGERFGRKIASFELGNSPTELTQQKLLNRRMIITTTNGTRAIKKAMRSDYLIAVSLLNVQAAAETLKLLNRDVVIFCAGHQDQFAIEDGYCAGMLIDSLMSVGLAEPVVLDDLGHAMLALYKHYENQAEDVLRQSKCGKRLLRSGQEADVIACSQTDVLDDVPLLLDNKLIRFNPYETITTTRQ